MGRTQPLLIVVLVVASVGMMPGIAEADDDWPDGCDKAPIVNPNGEQKVSIDTPKDQDYMKMQLTKGDYLHISTIVPDRQRRLVFVIGTLDNPDFSLQDLKNATIREAVSYRTPVKFDSEEVASFKFWGEREGTNTYCFRFEDDLGDEADIPYQFTVNFSLSSPEPPKVNNQRVEELESQLEQKNQRIEELESQSIENGDITIEVTVTPANNQENFLEGGEAVVRAESESADISEMVVEYGSGTYQLDSSGEVAIPLADTGTQEMTLIYGDITKQVSIEVQPQQDQNQQNQQDTTPTGTSGPGFGIIVSLIALFGGVFLLRHYR